MPRFKFKCQSCREESEVFTGVKKAREEANKHYEEKHSQESSIKIHLMRLGPRLFGPTTFEVMIMNVIRKPILQ